jgi:transposase
MRYFIPNRLCRPVPRHPSNPCCPACGGPTKYVGKHFTPNGLRRPFFRCLRHPSPILVWR